MQATGTVQMNTRLDASLKDAGDRVLSALGFTPSQAVRALWEFVVAHRDEPRSIVSLMESGDGVSMDEERTRRLEALEAGRTLCVGLGSLPDELAGASYEELRSSAYARRYQDSL